MDSDSRDKSCTVSINYLVKHEKYGKYIRKRTRIHVHDEDNAAKVGDRVEIVENVVRFQDQIVDARPGCRSCFARGLIDRHLAARQQQVAGLMS